MTLVPTLTPTIVGSGLGSIPSAEDVFGAGLQHYVMVDGDSDLTLSGSDIVSWADRGGSAAPLLGAVAPPQYVVDGLDGLPCARFDGVTEYMNSSPPTLIGYTLDIHAVLQFGSLPALGQDEVVLHAANDYKLELRNSGGTQLYRAYGAFAGAGGQSSTYGTPDIGTPHIVCLKSSDDEFALFVDGDETVVHAGPVGDVVGDGQPTVGCNPLAGPGECAEVDVGEIVFAFDAYASETSRADYQNSRVAPTWPTIGAAL